MSAVHIRVQSFLFLSIYLSFSQNHSRSLPKHRRRNIRNRTPCIEAIHYPRPTLHSKNTPECLPVDKITAILYTVVFSPAFFHLLSREEYNIQFVGYVHARRRLRSTSLPRLRTCTRCSTYITLIYICTYNSRAFMKFVRVLRVFCVCVLCIHIRTTA